MNKEEAISFAEKHIKQKNKTNLVKEIRRVVSEAKEKPEFWYFDNKFEFIERQNGNLSGIGGSPGFKVIKKDGAIIDVSWAGYSQIKNDPNF